MAGPAGLNAGREGGGLVAKKLHVLNKRIQYTTGLQPRQRYRSKSGQSVLCGSQRHSRSTKNKLRQKGA